MNKFIAKNTLYNDPKYDVVVDKRRLEQDLKEKDQQISELQKQLDEKTKTIEGLMEEQKNIENSASYQMFLDCQKQLEEKEKELREIRVENYTIKSYRDFLGNKCKNLIKENKKLKQQLRSQPAEIVEKIKKEFQKHLIDWYEDEENINNELYIDADWVWEVLDTILKEYQK